MNIRHNRDFSVFLGEGKKYSFRKAPKVHGCGIYEFESSICKEFSSLILKYEEKEISFSIYYELREKNTFLIVGEYYSISDDGRTIKIDPDLIGEFDFKMLQVMAFNLFNESAKNIILVGDEFPD